MLTSHSPLTFTSNKAPSLIRRGYALSTPFGVGPGKPNQDVTCVLGDLALGYHLFAFGIHQFAVFILLQALQHGFGICFWTESLQRIQSFIKTAIQTWQLTPSLSLTHLLRHLYQKQPEGIAWYSRERSKPEQVLSIKFPVLYLLSTAVFAFLSLTSVLPTLHRIGSPPSWMLHYVESHELKYYYA